MSRSKRWIGISFFLLFFWGSVPRLQATFYGDAKTGLQNIASDQYGYSIYVPTEYTSDRDWPLVVALHSEGERGEDFIQGWISDAEERGYLVFCPTYEEARENPVAHDERILRLKHSITSQYAVDPDKILITGDQSGGHYAFYLGLRYPNEFSAVAALGNAASGRYRKLFHFSFAEANRLPVLLLLGPDDAADEVRSDAELKELNERGYRVEVVATDTETDLSNAAAKSYLLDWFYEVSAERRTLSGARPFSFKQKFYEWIDQLLQNR